MVDFFKPGIQAVPSRHGAAAAAAAAVTMPRAQPASQHRRRKNKRKQLPPAEGFAAAGCRSRNLGLPPRPARSLGGSPPGRTARARGDSDPRALARAKWHPTAPRPLAPAHGAVAPGGLLPSFRPACRGERLLEPSGPRAPATCRGESRPGPRRGAGDASLAAAAPGEAEGGNFRRVRRGARGPPGRTDGRTRALRRPGWESRKRAVITLSLALSLSHSGPVAAPAPPLPREAAGFGARERESFEAGGERGREDARRRRLRGSAGPG